MKNAYFSGRKRGSLGSGSSPGNYLNVPPAGAARSGGFDTPPPVIE